MERTCFQALHYDVSIPTRHYFLCRFALAANMTKCEEMIANYLLELTLLDFSYNHVPASYVAASAAHLALQMIRPRSEPIWSASLKFHTQIDEEELIVLVKKLQSIHWSVEESKYTACSRKYNGKDKLFASQYGAVRAQDLRFDCSDIHASPVCPSLIPSPLSPSRRAT
jgi:hypothetical protein